MMSNECVGRLKLRWAAGMLYPRKELGEKGGSREAGPKLKKDSGDGQGSMANMSVGRTGPSLDRVGDIWEQPFALRDLVC